MRFLTGDNLNILNMDQNTEYANSLDLTNEALVSYKAYLIAHKFGLCEIEFRCMPKYADSDYAVFINGKFEHYLEVKTRRNTMNYYRETKIPLRKHATAEHYWRSADVKTYFLCKWQDKIAVIDITNEPDRVELQVARYDRGENLDIYACYKVSSFRVI